MALKKNRQCIMSLKMTHEAYLMKSPRLGSGGALSSQFDPNTVNRRRVVNTPFTLNCETARVWCFSQVTRAGFIFSAEARYQSNPSSNGARPRRYE